MTGRLTGRTALVFGGGSMKQGIMSNGRAVAMTFAREGAKVAVADINLAAAEETAAAITGEGHEAIALAADVALAESVAAAVAKTRGHFGPIDILHNNVGINEYVTMAEMTEAQWDKIMNANIKGMFLACKAVLPQMVERSSGVIINVSALASVRYLGPAVAYMTSKAAVNGFTQSVALEYAKHNIRCNAILPGFIDTPAGMQAYERGDPATIDARKAYRNSKLPGGRSGKPWDIANTALFLASDDSRYLNGVLLPVDGGVMIYSPTAI